MKSPAAGMNVSSVPAKTPGQRERQRHPQERLRLARVEVLGGLDQPVVDLLERDVQRQRHEGQEVVGDARDDGGRRREQAAVLAQDVQVAERPTTKPWSARMFCQASVRIRYVTKNGAMIASRNRFFQRPPRNAIQYASG